MNDLKTDLSKYIYDFSQFYSASLKRRAIIGVICGIIVNLIFMLMTFIFEIILWDNAFNQSFLHDFPLIGLICSFIVSLEVFGLIPHPISVINDKMEINNSDEN